MGKIKLNASLISEDTNLNISTTGIKTNNKIVYKENNITVNRLAEICELRQSTISNIINGNSKNPTIISIKKICAGLGISISSFFNHPLFEEENKEESIK